MIELSHLFSTLIDCNGNILIDGISDQVNPVTDEERSMYTDIDFSPEGYRAELECGRLLSDDKTELLMKR
jgi:hypothetical protein